MRPLLLLSLSALILAGCTQSTDEASTDAAQDAFVPEAPAFDAIAAYQRNSTCDNDCDYDDGLYHQYVLYDPESPEIDVLIVPSISTAPVEDLQMSKDAVLDWRRGLDEFAPEWLRDGIQINAYAVGLDVPSADAVQDPEIIVVLVYTERTGLAGGYAGIGLEPEQNLCGQVWQINEPESQVTMQNCTGTGYRCVALNTIQSDTIDRLTNLVVHEVGHCFGAGHAGNAGDFQSKIYPHMDAMSYGGDPPRTRCVSNMNIELLARLYGPLLDADVEPVGRGDFITYEPEAYRQGACSPAEAEPAEDDDHQANQAQQP